MTKIYIAGPMRGYKYFNFPAFDIAEAMLRDAGWDVVSPAQLDREAGFDPETLPDNHDWTDINSIGFCLSSAIKRDIAALETCDAIFMLQGWENSLGAKAELALAQWMGHEVMYELFPPRNIEDTAVSDAKAATIQPNLTDGQTVTNERGGKQSYILARFDCIPPEVLRLLAQCLGFGAAKYGKDNWRNIDFDDNVSHCMNHLNEWRRGDRSEPHLVNAMARLTFALSQAVDGGDQAENYVHPEMLTGGNKTNGC